jgi:hypothetical protein
MQTHAHNREESTELQSEEDRSKVVPMKSPLRVKVGLSTWEVEPKGEQL